VEAEAIAVEEEAVDEIAASTSPPVRNAFWFWLRSKVAKHLYG